MTILTRLADSRLLAAEAARRVHHDCGGLMLKFPLNGKFRWRVVFQRQGREPRPLHHLSDGGGRGAAADVPGNSVADRPAAGAASAGMRGLRSEMEAVDSGRSAS